MERLKLLPFEDLDFAKVDHHRALRQGFAEVVFGKGKTAIQVAEIVTALLGAKPGRQNILVTRADSKMFAAVKGAAGKKNGAVKFHPLSGAITIERTKRYPVRELLWWFPRGPATFPWPKRRCLRRG